MSIRTSTYAEHLLAETCPTMRALIEARQSGDWKAIRRAARLHHGWLRESGTIPAVPGRMVGGYEEFSLMAQRGPGARHHTH